MGKAKKVSRPVVYEKVSTRLCTGEKGITMEYAEKLLGWCEDEKKALEEGHGEPHLVLGTRKVWFLNNYTNRPIYKGIWKKLKQVILNDFWVFNGEPAIIGRTGLVLDSQHTLIAVKLAEEDRLKNIQYYEHRGVTKPISIDKLIVFGVDESDEVVNTINTCQSRTLADVIYRGPYYRERHTSIRRQLARITETAVTMLWYHTGVSDVIMRTHMEMIDWLDRHPKICDAIKHIYDENDKRAIARYISLGHAACYMYLQASYDTDDEEYHAKPVEERSEKDMDFAKWKEASEFWVLLAKGTEFQLVRDALKSVVGERINAVVAEKSAIIAKAWDAFVKEGVVKKKDISLESNYTEIDPKTETRHLIGIPLFGGIDLGNKDQRVPTNLESSPEEVAEVEEAKEEINKSRGEPAKEGVDWSWLDRLHDENPTVEVILAKSSLGNWVAWGPNGELVATVTGRENKMNPKGVKCVSVKPSDLDEVVRAINKAGHKVGLAEEEKDGWVIQTIHAPSSVETNGESKKPRRGAKKT